MNRYGYSDCLEPWALICWRGAVSSAIRGKRGQAFLKEMLATLDAMPEKKLIKGALVIGISQALVREIEFINDEAWVYPTGITDEYRFEIVRNWVARQIKAA